MYEFIVLGLIPGTRIQISFGVWLVLANSLLALVIWRRMQRAKIVHAALIAFVLLQTARRRVKLMQTS